MSWEEVTIGPCRLILADCAEVLPTLGTVDALITDPPYGLELGIANNMAHDSSHLHKQAYRTYNDTYAAFVEDIVPRLNLALDHASCAAVFTGPHIHEQRKPIALGGIYHPSAIGRTPWGSKNFLPVLFYGKPPTAGRHQPTVLYSTTKAEVMDFPCPKPLTWMTWLVSLASRAGETILDPFMGSGTTGIACLKLNRRFVGVEQDHHDFTLARQRIKEAYSQLDMFATHQAPKPKQLTLA